MQGALFILYILVVSGVIAAIADRVGYRIGKLRWSWFNLRPRTTATLMTVLTGVLISAVTLGLLFYFNRTLLHGLFNYSRDISALQWQASIARQQLDLMQKSLEDVSEQRQEALDRVAALLQEQQQLVAEQAKLQQQRDEVSQRLEVATATLAETQAQLRQAAAQLQKIERQATQAQETIQTLAAQKQQLEQERASLQASLQEAEAELQDLAGQKQALEKEIERLTQVAQRFRLGQVRIWAGEVLATGVVEGGRGPLQTQQSLNALLLAAEQQARRLGALPTPPLDRAIQLPRADAEMLLRELQKPGSWVVRLLSVSNRLAGESVPVIADVAENRLLFDKGTVLASTQIPPNLSEGAVQEQLIRLFSLANFRSRQAGLLADPLTGTVGEFSQVRLLEAVEQLQQISSPATVEVRAAADIFTAGPLQVDLMIRFS
ncbi:MAG: DUF3084 domain-containing protein [Thermostichales cyanobacterium GMQP_bins_62]